MKKSVLLVLMMMVFSTAGCQYAGLLGIIFTPSQDEEKIPAQYDLAKYPDKKTMKILVLVEQPGWLGADFNLRKHLTNSMTKTLIKRIKLEPENMIAYEELSDFRSQQADFQLLLPTEVGKALNADLVLHVVIENYSLNEMATTGYLRGFMHSQNALFDVKSDERLWPESPTSRAVKVGFEVEERGKEFAAGRLFMALSHCTVRYLYNSPKLKFRIADDRGTLGWESWNR